MRTLLVDNASLGCIFLAPIISTNALVAFIFPGPTQWCIKAITASYENHAAPRQTMTISVFLAIKLVFNISTRRGNILNR
jgi:uncharacterized membrane protein